MKTISGITSLVSIIIFILFTFISCEDKITDNEPVEQLAYIRIIHSAASEDKLDFRYIDLNNNINDGLVYDVAYGNQRGYYAFTIDPTIFLAYYNNTNILAAKDTVFFETERTYSVIANDLDATINPELLIIEDSYPDLTAGKTYIRFLNLSNNVPAINVTDEDANLIQSNLQKQHASDYIEFDAGTYEFHISDYSTGDNLLSFGPATFNEGTIYTAIISGAVINLIDVELNVKIYQDISIE